MEDAAQELDRLIARVHEMISQFSDLKRLTEKFQGPFFESIQKIGQNWVEHARKNVLVPLSTILQEVDTTGDSSYTMQQFSNYLDTIRKAVSTMPMFITDTSSIATYSPQMLRSNQRMIKNLLEGADQLRQFIQLRSQIYSVLINELSALWHSVLPPEIPISQVITTMGLNPSQSVDDLIPDPIPTVTLPLALQQAEEALALWNSAIDQSTPFLNKALILNQILQSPAVEKFLNAEKRRLELSHEWRPRITETFNILRSILQT